MRQKKRKNNSFYSKLLAFILGNRLQSKNDNVRSSLPHKQYSTIIQKSDQLLLEEKLFLNNNITLIDLAKEVGTNRTYLSISIKSAKNQSFSEYINSNRIEYSKHLIQKTVCSCTAGIDNSSMTTEDYAIASGFSSARNFVRCFKAKEGITPSQYKNAILWKVRK